MGLNPNMDTCSPKKKCLFGLNESLAYDPSNPCTEAGEVFDVDTCSCIATSPCGGSFSASGGIGITVQNVDVGPGPGVVTFSWEAYIAKDSFTLTGAVSFSTGVVSGNGTVFLPKTSGSSIVIVTVQGFTQGTAWNFSLSCTE